MKRLLLIAVLSCLIHAGASAAPVSRSAAAVSAKKFFSERGLNAAVSEVSGVKLSRSVANDDNPPYHIFNIGNSEGYVIVAGDDRLQPILGYSTEGAISPDAIPAACKTWLETYAAEIASLSADALRVDAQADRRLTYSATPVSPLLKSRWGQDDPYNLDCPTDAATGKKTATGCVATATAQLMYFYNYPSRATGSITYEDKAQNVSRTLDFTTLPPFDWANMTDTYDETSTPEARSAVANLMKAAAFGERMQFGSGTSLTYHYCAGHALIDYFGYDPAMHIYERAFMTDQEWIDVITAELEAGRPVIYDGNNAAGGHTFVCDGHDGNGFFHFNWGWGGLSDGYFSLSALTPAKQSTGSSDGGYTLRQTVTCHIFPAGTLPSVPQTEHLLNIDKLYFRDASQYYLAESTPAVHTTLKDAQLFFYSFNKGFSSFTGEICAATVSDDGTLAPILSTKVEEVGSNSYAKMQLNLADAQLTDGTYLTRFYYRQSEADGWHSILTSSVSKPSACYLTVDGTNVTISTVMPDIAVSLVSQLEETPLFSNAPAKWTLDLRNDGSVRFEGYAGVALVNPDGTFQGVYAESVLCPAGETLSIDIKGKLTAVNGGKYSLVPFISSSPNPTPQEITPLSSPVEVNVATIVILPSAGTYFLMESPETVPTITLSNMTATEWQGRIEAEVETQDGSKLLPGLFAAEVYVGPNVTATATLSADGLELPRGTYTMKFYAAPGRDILLAEFPLLVTADISALDAISAPGTDIRIESGRITMSSPEGIAAGMLHDLAGRKVVSANGSGESLTIETSGLQEGVYFLTVISTDGVRKTEKVVIRN